MRGERRQANGRVRLPQKNGGGTASIPIESEPAETRTPATIVPAQAAHVRATEFSLVLCPPECDVLRTSVRVRLPARGDEFRIRTQVVEGGGVQETGLIFKLILQRMPRDRGCALIGRHNKRELITPNVPLPSAVVSDNLPPITVQSRSTEVDQLSRKYSRLGVIPATNRLQNFLHCSIGIRQPLELVRFETCPHGPPDEISCETYGNIGSICHVGLLPCCWLSKIGPAVGDVLFHIRVRFRQNCRERRHTSFHNERLMVTYFNDCVNDFFITIKEKGP